MPLCRSSHRCWGKDSALNDHARCGWRHLTARTTHHTGEGEGGPLVSHHQIGRIESAHLMVKGLKALTLLGKANLHGIAHLGAIKRMCWLTQLQHDVVRRIDHVRD